MLVPLELQRDLFENNRWWSCVQWHDSSFQQPRCFTQRAFYLGLGGEEHPFADRVLTAVTVWVFLAA